MLIRIVKMRIFQTNIAAFLINFDNQNKSALND
jgi:hypothetical protein